MIEEILVQILIFPHLRYSHEVESHSHTSEYESYIVEDPVLKILNPHGCPAGNFP